MVVSAFDEYPLQQFPTTFDHVGDSDRRWFERFWACAVHRSGELALVHGIGVYPNANLMDGFCLLARGGQQGFVSASRALAHDRMNTTVGPVLMEVVRGLREVRVALGNNASGLAYDLRLVSNKAPYGRVPLPMLRAPGGELLQHVAVFSQLGRASGRLTVAGEDIDLNPEDWSFTKVNAWGVRAHGGVMSSLSGTKSGTAFFSASLPTIGITVMDDVGEISPASGARLPIDKVQWTLDSTAGQLKAAHIGLGNDDIEIDISPLFPATFGAGSFGAYCDGFDGRYRGEEAYGRSARVDAIDMVTPSEGSRASDRTRRLYIVAVHVRGQWKDSGVGLLELASE